MGHCAVLEQSNTDIAQEQGLTAKKRDPIYNAAPIIIGCGLGAKHVLFQLSSIHFMDVFIGFTRQLNSSNGTPDGIQQKQTITTKNSPTALKKIYLIHKM